MSKLQPWQRINHFPGMSNIARKNRLAQNLEKMRREFPKEYSFYPRTWVLPLELADFRAQFDSHGRSSRFYIIKPDSGCQGRGIFLTQNFDSISPLEQVVAQFYIRKPFLIDGFKFDLRLYVLVTSCKPLRVHMFHDGLVRLCTKQYLKPNAENVGMRCMHLTNYAINKHSENFQSNENLGASDVGSKRSLRWFMEYIAGERGQSKADALWCRMGSMAVKVIISILPILVREYESIFFKATGVQARPSNFENEQQKHQHAIQGSRCFELLGIDVIIDHALKPWLVEVNHLPSFGTDSPLDLDVKSRVIEQTISTIQVKASDRFCYEQTERDKAEERLYSHLAIKSTPPIGEQPHEALIAPFRRRIEHILEQHAPDKLIKVEALLQKYAGREAKLVRLVEKKYVNQINSPEANRHTRAEQSNEEHVIEMFDKEVSPSTSHSDTDSDVNFEDQVLVDFDRVYPVPPMTNAEKHHIPNYKALKKYVFAQDEKRIKRMSCPLRQHRGSALYFAETLPRLDGTKSGRDPFCGKPAALSERKPLPMPGHKQLAAADRLTRGFPSRQHSSAPSSLGTSEVIEGDIENYTKKVASSRAHAREWRRKMLIGRHRRSGQVALQPKTFMFTADI